jgi:hypothetical protein
MRNCLEPREIPCLVLFRPSLATGVTALTAAAGGLGALTSLSRYYKGPVSDHFDGRRFFDPQGSAPKSFTDLLRWQFGKRPVPWPDRHPSPYSDTPPQRVDNPRDWRVSYVGHASLLIQVAGLNILLDPVWSERASPWSFAGPKRVNDPGIPFRSFAADRCRAGVALPLRPHGCRHLVGARRQASSALRGAAGQRHHHPQPRSGGAGRSL